MCIYYIERPELNYKKQEHIIPAGIGGVLKLPKGYVSDEFNNDISKLEMEFFREGILSMPRQIFGPGKRGSLSENKATKSKVHLISGVHSKEQFALGYTSAGKVYEIPHLLWNTNTGESIFSFNKSYKEAEEVINEFQLKCKDADTLKIKIIITDKLPDDIAILGIQQGIEENFDCFYACNEGNGYVINAEKIKKIGAGMTFSDSPKAEKYLPKAHLKANFKRDYFRIYGKIAFNFLAFEKGEEFVKHEQFDSVRNWIATGGEYDFVRIDNQSENPLLKVSIDLPKDAHFIYFTQSEQTLISQIFLYGGYSVILLLSNALTKRVGTDVFICDWRNRQEYKLAEYVEKFKGNLYCES
jgi:hypothetical protein